MLLRIALLIVIVLFSALGYMTYLNHEIPVTLFLIQGRPLTTSIPAVIIVSFASGALIVFVASLMRDLVEGWRQLRRDRKEKKDESVQGEIAKGLDFLAQGNTDRAQTHLTNALRRDPENVDLCARLSDLLAAQGRLNEAIDMLDRAWALDSQNREILLTKAKLCEQMGNRSLVIGTLKKLLAMDPGNLRALVELRDIHLREENWEKARALQRNLMREKRNGPDTAQEKDRYLGITYEYARSLPARGDDGASEKSIRLCKEMIRQDRGFLPAYLLIGEIYQKQKRWVEAGRVLGRGFRVSKHVIFLLRLEDLYLKKNDRRTLLKIHRRIIESNSGNTIFPSRSKTSESTWPRFTASWLKYSLAKGVPRKRYGHTRQPLNWLATKNLSSFVGFAGENPRSGSPGVLRVLSGTVIIWQFMKTNRIRL